jgi:hypothetical protein
VLIALLAGVSDHVATETLEDIVQFSRCIGVIFGVRDAIAESKHGHLLTGDIKGLKDGDKKNYDA